MALRTLARKPTLAAAALALGATTAISGCSNSAETDPNEYADFCAKFYAFQNQFAADAELLAANSKSMTPLQIQRVRWRLQDSIDAANQALPDTAPTEAITAIQQLRKQLESDKQPPPSTRERENSQKFITWVEQTCPQLTASPSASSS